MDLCLSARWNKVGRTGEVLSGASGARWEGPVPVTEESDSQENTASRARTPAEPGSARAQALGWGSPTGAACLEEAGAGLSEEGASVLGILAKHSRKGEDIRTDPCWIPHCLGGVRPYIVYF